MKGSSGTDRWIYLVFLSAHSRCGSRRRSTTNLARPLATERCMEVPFLSLCRARARCGFRTESKTNLAPPLATGSALISSCCKSAFRSISVVFISLVMQRHFPVTIATSSRNTRLTQEILDKFFPRDASACLSNAKRALSPLTVF